MAGKGVSYIKWRKSSRRCFMTALSSALLEWLLILMLLINGVFAYLITWFARYCELPIPCLLCSRLDHLFGNQRMGSQWDLMCKSHKSEISSLVLCTLHQKLVDVHGMCENCLFSFATKDKSNPETYRLLVGKLGLDPGNNVDENLQSKDTKICCCCNEPWNARSYPQELVKTKSVDTETGDVDDAPLTREFRLNWNSAKKESKRPIFVAARSDVHESFEDCSPHFGYSELNLDSDSDTEDQICDIQEPKPRALNISPQSSNLIDHEQFQSDLIKSEEISMPEKVIVQDSTLLEPLNLIDNWMKPQEDTVPEKPIVPDASVLEHPNLIDHDSSLSDVVESKAAPSTLPTSVGHGLEELNWQDIDLKTESCSASDPINTDNVPELPNAIDIKVDPPKVLEQKEVEAPIEVRQISKPEIIERVNEAEKEHTTTDVLDSKVKKNVNDGGGVQPANNMELGDAYKLAISSRGRQLSSKSLEQLIGKDSPRVSQDLRLLLSQLSGLISPRMSGNLDDSRTLVGMQLLQKRISLERNDSRNSLERNESGFESLDVSIVGEIEGESEVDRLKRQIEFDKKFMSGLYKELEEERNASAVAANQALAMITRLQEEKAALQMEALHDIRMMEDQAEYDVEALDRANEILAEKEREIQDLEAELDYYRIKYPDDELMLENEDSILDSRSPRSSWIGFEDERLNISQKLSNLEKKLHLFSTGGIYPDLQNGASFNMEEERKTWKKDDGDDNVVLQTNNPASFGDRRTLVRRVNSMKTPRSVVVQDSAVHKEADVVELSYEVSTLNERLQALEADRNFLEHAINSLRNGEEGVRFVQEIASHLQELRRVGIKRKQSLA